MAITQGGATLKPKLPFPHVIAASPVLRRDPFDHADYLFELKHDGFRALAYVDREGTRLVSRRRNVYRSFPRLCGAIRGELKCEAGRGGENSAKSSPPPRVLRRLRRLARAQWACA